MSQDMAAAHMASLQSLAAMQFNQRYSGGGGGSGGVPILEALTFKNAQINLAPLERLGIAGLLDNMFPLSSIAHTFNTKNQRGLLELLLQDIGLTRDKFAASFSDIKPPSGWGGSGIQAPDIGPGHSA